MIDDLGARADSESTDYGLLLKHEAAAYTTGEQTIVGKTIRVGVFGAGNFANNQHLPNLTEVEGVDIVAICDVNEQAARETAGRFSIPRVYADGHEMLDKEPMDAMWSIVPAFARTDVEATAASKGIHLFSEKPQAIEMTVARRIDNAIRDAGGYRAVFEAGSDAIATPPLHRAARVGIFLAYRDILSLSGYS